MNESYLIDTHVLLWLSNEPNKISAKAASVIGSSASLFVSYVSVWEMAIKISTGKLTIDYPLNEFLNTAIAKHSLVLLPISLNAILRTRELGFHHKDPFDRLLIAEAINLSLTVITSDSQFDKYPVSLNW